MPWTIGAGVAMGFMDEAMVIIELIMGGCMGMSEFTGPIEGVAMGLIECGMDMDIEDAMDGVAEGVM